MRNTHLQKLCGDFEKVHLLESKNISKILCKSISYIQSHEEIWREDGRDTCGTKKVSL